MTTNKHLVRFVRYIPEVAEVELPNGLPDGARKLAVIEPEAFEQWLLNSLILSARDWRPMPSLPRPPVTVTVIDSQGTKVFPK